MILNADGTSGGACPSPAWDTFAYNTVGLSTPHSTQFCSVSSTGLVTATAGINWGGCFVTVSVTGLYQRWIAGLIGTTGTIPHFGSDGQIHTTCTSASDCMWVSTTFETGPSANSANPGFLDQEIQPRLSLLGNPFNQVGFNTLEPGAGGAPMQNSQTLFNSGMTAQLSTYNNFANTFGLYFHPNLSSIISCAGGSDAAYAGADAFWSWTLGSGLALSTPAVSQIASSWQGTGKVLGFTSKDEITVSGPFNYPGAIGTIGATGGPTSITTDSSGRMTINWNPPSGYLTGPAYASCGMKIRITGTGTALDNGSSPFAWTFYYPGTSNTLISNSLTTLINGTVTSGTVNAYAYLNEDGAGSFTPNNAFDTFMNQFRAATPHPTIGHPMFWSGNDTLSPAFCGNQTYSDFCEIYQNTNTFYEPQNISLAGSFMALGPGSFANTGTPVYRNRSVIANAGSQRAVLGYTSSVQYNYFFNQPNYSPLTWSCSGDTCTSSTDHGIRNVLGSGVTALTISGSSDPQWNDTLWIASAPTATTVKVAKGRSSDLAVDATTNTKVTAASHSFVSGDIGKYVNVASGSPWTTGAYQISSVSSGAAILASSPAAAGTSGGRWFFSPYPATGNKTDGTITWDDGTTSAVSSMNIAGDMTLVSGYCVHRGHNFTLSGGTTGGAFWTNTTFYNEAFQSDALSSTYCQNHGYNDNWRFYLPSGEASGSVNVKVWADADYHKGLTVNQGENLTGPLPGAWNVLNAAVTRATGTRMYPNVGPNFSFRPYGTSSAYNETVINGNGRQPGASPLYNNGDGGMIPGFYAYGPPQLLLESLAARGYLYGTPSANGCPDQGFVIDCDLRSSSKGNLLLTLNGSNATLTRAVDISGCAVAGQPTIRYTVDITGIVVSTISAGTTSDTPTWPAGGAVIYLCSNNEAAEYSPPQLAFPLTDVPNATQIEVQYAPEPWLLNQNYYLALHAFSCGSGSCPAPWDLGIGPIYFRALYLNSANQVLAQSDVQQLPGR